MPAARPSRHATADPTAPGGARAVARCDALGVAPYSDTATGLFHGWLGPAHRATVQQVGAWMEAAGMQVRIDPLGTLVGHYAGTQPNAPALLIGSHQDSVRDAGRYDCPLGILLGIECVAALHAQERRLPFAIDVVAFGDEEGSRFPASLFCSRAVTGTLDPTTLTVTDAAGITVASALAEWNLDIAHVQHAARAPGSVLAYLETHIEHGPVPEAEALPVGSVSDIAIAPLQTLTASPGAPALITRMEHAVAAQGIAPRQLVSGAGHDAMVMAALCPTAMLCVRCAGGISHHPDEHVDPADAELALAVMRHFIEHLGDSLVT